MSITIRDESTAAALATAAGPLELHGPSGTLLGRFIPATTPSVSFPEFGLSDEDLNRQLNDPNEVWVTPETVMDRLREIDRCSR